MAELIKFVSTASKHFRNDSLFRYIKFVTIVPQGEEYILETFGKFDKTLTPGLKFYWPFIQQIAYTIPRKELCVPINPQNAITKDNVMITMAGTLYVTFTDSYKAAYGADEPIRAIIQHAQSSMRAKIGSMSLDEIFRERTSINSSIYDSINDNAEKWGAVITRFELTDVSPSDHDVIKSLHLQATAERNRRAAVKDAEAKKQATELEAEAYKYQIEMQATADANAARLRTDAEKYNVEKLNEALYNNPAISQYLLQQKSIEAWDKIARASSVVVVPADASALIGAASAVLKSCSNIINPVAPKLA